MTEIRHGDIVRYSYLWAREHGQGEVTGRKARPTCVMIVLQRVSGGQQCLLFPITSQKPGANTVAVEIPEMEARRANLYQPAWVVVDELNRDDLSKSYALEDTRPLGSFSRKFMLKLAGEVREVARARKMKIVSRK